MKTLYEFSIKDDKKQEHKFRILKPNRRQIEEAEMEYAVEMSRCIKRGILTKTMLAKKYSDTGGLMSERQAKRLMELYKEVHEKTNEHARLSSLQKKSKKQKDRMDEIVKELTKCKREIVDIETSNLSLFNQTAETKAQNAAVRWYMINLSQYWDDGEWRNVYKGEDYEDKLDFFYEKEDGEEDPLYFQSMSKVVSVLALWFFNQGDNQEEFDSLLEEFEESEEDEETEESEKEENDKPDEAEE